MIDNKLNLIISVPYIMSVNINLSDEYKETIMKKRETGKTV